MRLFWIILLLTTTKTYAQGSNYPADLLTDYNVGVEAFDNGDLETAHLAFDKCLKLDSNCFEAHLNIGHINFIRKDYNACITSCLRAENLRPFDPKLNALLGKVYFKTSILGPAETYLKRSISLGDTSIDTHMYLAQTLQGAKKFTEAAHYYDQILSRTPQNYEANFNTGILCFKLDKLDEAITYFKKAQELNPENSIIYGYLAEISFHKSQDEEGLAFLEKGLSMATGAERVDLLLLKGNFYQRKGDTEKAQEIFDEAYLIEKNNPLILNGQAAVYIDLEEYESAIEKCNLALENDPKLAVAWLNKGIANEMLRNVDAACGDWQKAFVLGSQEAIDYLNSPVCNE